jgi:hypothetical protein
MQFCGVDKLDLHLSLEFNYAPGFIGPPFEKRGDFATSLVLKTSILKDNGYIRHF